MNRNTIRSNRPIAFLLIGLTGFATGCTGMPDMVRTPPDNHESIRADRLPSPDRQVAIDGLSRCTDATDTTLSLAAGEPVHVIVHGCYASAGRFRSLAEVFEFHGQQTVCFNYNDRDRITASADELRLALKELVEAVSPSDLTVLGHSQGGLVARSAYRARRGSPAAAPSRLVTVSAPFNGIQSASHCGYTWLHYASLGISAGVCQLITGSKWTEIPPGSDFIEYPGELDPLVAGHFRIVTDERDTCRRRDDKGRCIEDDFVFSLSEQYRREIDSDRRTRIAEVAAGHAEIVGNEDTIPYKLIRILQANGIMERTAEADDERLAALLKRIYLPEPPASADREPVFSESLN